MSTQILKQRPEGHRAVAHRVPLLAAKHIAEKEKGAVVVNLGGGRYSVFVPREAAVVAPVSLSTNGALSRAILGGE